MLALFRWFTRTCISKPDLKYRNDMWISWRMVLSSYQMSRCCRIRIRSCVFLILDFDRVALTRPLSVSSCSSDVLRVASSFPPSIPLADPRSSLTPSWHPGQEALHIFHSDVILDFCQELHVLDVLVSCQQDHSLPARPGGEVGQALEQLDLVFSAGVGDTHVLRDLLWLLSPEPLVASW